MIFLMPISLHPFRNLFNPKLIFQKVLECHKWNARTLLSLLQRMPISFVNMIVKVMIFCHFAIISCFLGFCLGNKLYLCKTFEIGGCQWQKDGKVSIDRIKIINRI